MKKWIIYIIGFLSITKGYCFVEEAQKFYLNKQYDKAIEFYIKDLKANGETGTTLYNLANAYLKSGKYSEARLYFEKALWFLPRDKDIKNNLKYVLEKIGANKLSSTNALKEIYQKIINLLSPREWIIVSLVIIIIFSGRIFMSIIKGKIFILELIVIGVAIMLPISKWWMGQYRGTYMSSNRGTVLYGEPSKKSKKIGKIKAGVELKKIKQNGEDWIYIRTDGNRLGWVRIKDVLKMSAGLQ